MPTGDTTTTAPKARRSRRIRVGGAAVLVVALVIAAAGWYTHSDERRVDAACGTYLQHRGLLRAALSETDEANGRAVHAKASWNYCP